jgi:hypothetical protein
LPNVTLDGLGERPFPLGELAALAADARKSTIMNTRIWGREIPWGNDMTKF